MRETGRGAELGTGGTLARVVGVIAIFRQLTETAPAAA